MKLTCHYIPTKGIKQEFYTDLFDKLPSYLESLICDIGPCKRKVHIEFKRLRPFVYNIDNKFNRTQAYFDALLSDCDIIIFDNSLLTYYFLTQGKDLIKGKMIYVWDLDFMYENTNIPYTIKKIISKKEIIEDVIVIPILFLIEELNIEGFSLNDPHYLIKKFFYDTEKRIFTIKFKKGVKTDIDKFFENIVSN